MKKKIKWERKGKEEAEGGRVTEHGRRKRGRGNRQRNTGQKEQEQKMRR